jgi:hypothetical protein
MNSDLLSGLTEGTFSATHDIVALTKGLVKLFLFGHNLGS